MASPSRRPTTMAGTSPLIVGRTMMSPFLPTLVSGRALRPVPEAVASIKLTGSPA
jgi:hypothetical protein